MYKKFIIIAFLVCLTGCAHIREQERRDTLANMTTDQKVAYLADENERMNRDERRLKHKVVMAKFFPRMFFNR